MMGAIVVLRKVTLPLAKVVIWNGFRVNDKARQAGADEIVNIRLRRRVAFDDGARP